MYTVRNSPNLNGRNIENPKKLSHSKLLTATAVAGILAGVTTAAISLAVLPAAGMVLSIALALTGVALAVGSIALLCYLRRGQGANSEGGSGNGRDIERSSFSNTQFSHQNAVNPPSYFAPKRQPVVNESPTCSPKEIRQRAELDKDVRKMLIEKGYNDRKTIEALEKCHRDVQKKLIERDIFDELTFRLLNAAEGEIQRHVAWNDQFDFKQLEKLDWNLYDIVKLRFGFKNDYLNKDVPDCFFKLGYATQAALMRSGPYNEERKNLILELDNAQFDRAVEVAIVEGNYCDSEKIRALVGLDPSLQLKIILSGRGSLEELELFRKFNKDVQEKIASDGYFEPEKLERLIGLDPKVQMAIMANENVDRDKINMLASFSDPVKVAIIKNNYFDKEKLTKLSGLSDPVQLACIKHGHTNLQVLDMLHGLTADNQAKIIEYGINPEDLKGFSAEALNFLLGTDFVTSRSTGFEWTNKQLQHFNPDEINLLLEKFGHKFFSLDFTGYQQSLKSIDFSNCKNLYALTLNEIQGLEKIGGLGNCGKLHRLNLVCTIFDSTNSGNSKNDILDAILSIPNKDIIINCKHSNLVIEDEGTLKKQFGRNGHWTKFLKRHPGASVLGLLNNKECALAQDSKQVLKKLNLGKNFRLDFPTSVKFVNEEMGIVEKNRFYDILPESNGVGR